MPRSIVDIEVNDEAFKAFAEHFNKYREELKAMPGEWGKSEKVVDSVAEGFQAMSAAIMAQTLMLHEQTKELEEQEKVEAKAARAKREDERAEAKFAERRKRDTQQLVGAYKSILGFAAKTTLQLLKWIGVGSVVSGLLGVGGFFGLNALADRVADSRRTSQGLGLSTGQLEAFKINYGTRFGMGQDFLEGVANAKNDVTQWGAFAAMGVNPSGKDPVALGLELQKRAASLWNGSSKTVQEADARGLTKFFSMDQLRQMERPGYGRDIAEAERSYRIHAKQLEVIDETNRKWVEFSVQLKSAGARIGQVFITALAPLLPQFEKLSMWLVDMLAKIMKSDDVKKWLTAVTEGLEKLGNHLLSPDFQQKMRDLGSNIVMVVDGLVRALRILKLIPDGSTTDAPFYGDDAAKAAAAQLHNQSGKDKATWDNAVIKFFDFQLGTKPHQAAGIVANLRDESNLNPFQYGHGDEAKGGKSEAYGLAQWHADRRKDFAKVFGHTMESVTDPQKAMGEQLAFIVWELKNKPEYHGALTELLGSKNAYAAGAIVSKLYERPFDPLGIQQDQRGRDAQVTITVYNNTGGSASVSTNQLAQ